MILHENIEKSVLAKQTLQIFFLSKYSSFYPNKKPDICNRISKIKYLVEKEICSAEFPFLEINASNLSVRNYMLIHVKYFLKFTIGIIFLYGMDFSSLVFICKNVKNIIFRMHLTIYIDRIIQMRC